MMCCSHCRDSTSNGSTTNFVFLAISTSHCKSEQLIYSETPTMKKKIKTSKQSKLTDLFIKKDVPNSSLDSTIKTNKSLGSTPVVRSSHPSAGKAKPVANGANHTESLGPVENSVLSSVETIKSIDIAVDGPVVGTEVIISRKSDSNSVEETNAFTDGTDNDMPVTNRISSRRGKLLFVYFLLVIFYLLLFNGFNGFQANQSLNTRNDLTEKRTLDLNSIHLKKFYF